MRESTARSRAPVDWQSVKPCSSVRRPARRHERIERWKVSMCDDNGIAQRNTFRVRDDWLEDFMNARLLWLAGLALTSNINALGQSKRRPLEGVWQVAEVTRSGAAGAMLSQPGPNLTIFAAKHYSRIDVHTQRPRPALSNPATATAEELREV